MEKGEGKTSKKAALFVTTMSAFVTSLSLSSVNVALPSIGKTFSLNAVYMNWIMLTYTLATSIFLVPIGKIADIYGRKKVFLAGTGIFTGACLLMGFSINPEMLIILRVVQGIGSASLFGIGVAILSSVYPPGERGKNIGITVTGVYSGLSLGPFVGGLITHHIGWRGVFFMNVPFGIAMLIVILLKLKGEWLDARGEKFDLIGSIIY
ncbi:MAG: MFS transporter, partial [Syntrophorhabdaceae bacterium]|nr:MFS transporter [Syntrophorhabdaceae bacterium]